MATANETRTWEATDPDGGLVPVRVDSTRVASTRYWARGGRALTGWDCNDAPHLAIYELDGQMQLAECFICGEIYRPNNGFAVLLFAARHATRCPGFDG